MRNASINLLHSFSKAMLLTVIAATLLPSLPARAQPSLADAIERAEASVVRIEVSGSDGDSLGSGFVVDDQGTIITNCHVLAGANSAVVYFPNGRSCPIVGTLIIEESRDIVVARISITDAPAIKIATALPRKGEAVTALGAPIGLSFTATSGIVSAIRPAAEMAADMGRSSIQGTWIQVDTPLSPGNSGGPLINSAGEVVAMSTLASGGGRAQNLNFGISAGDVLKAIHFAGRSQLVSLSMGVGKVKMHDAEPGPGPGGGSGPGLAAKEIPEAAFQAYIESGKEDYAELMRGLRMESARLSLDLKEMRKGSTRMPASVAAGGAAIARVSRPGKREHRWYFLSDSIKQTALEKQRKRIRKYTQLKNKIKNIDDAESMYSLLWNYGPELQTRRNKSIGFATDIFVIHAFNDHDVLAVHNETPCLLWMESTVGISSGEILSGPTYVAGTATAPLRNGMTTSLTVYQEVTESQLRAAVDKHFGGSGMATSGDGAEQSGGYRTWNDRSGRFSIEALLLSSDGTNVTLKKRDGSVVNVPVSALSDSDLRYLKN